MAANQANITGLIGASGSGKSMHGRERFRRAFRGLTLVWSPLERTDEYANFLHGRAVTWLPDIVAAIRDGERTIVYVPDVRDKLKHQFDLWCRLVWQASEKYSVRCLVEEVHRVTFPSWAPPAWSNLTTGGSHHQGIELIATTQRPARIDKDFLGQCTELRCFRLIYPADAQAVSAVTGVPADELLHLEDLHYMHCMVRKRTWSRGVQKIIR